MILFFETVTFNNVTIRHRRAKLGKIQAGLQRSQGQAQDLAEGRPRNIFFRFGNLPSAKRHAAPGEATRFARGVWGHAHQEFFLKWCNLVRFGLFLDQIYSLKNHHFLYKIF